MRVPKLIVGTLIGALVGGTCIFHFGAVLGAIVGAIIGLLVDLGIVTVHETPTPTTIPAPVRPFRFSLRTLFIVVGLAGLLLGLVTWLVWAWAKMMDLEAHRRGR